MPGPCPNGRPTTQAHEQARCRDRGKCTGPGCRVRRDPWHEPLLTDAEQRHELRKLERAAASTE